VATYKLIQDIEAEDHILGPLTLRQFIFALVAALFIYMNVFAVSKGVPYLMALFLPPALFFGFFAVPFGRDQSTEVWALAKLRFMFKPRRRVWDQNGIKELVTITAPKKVEPVLTNGLSPYEVESRLKALADTIDSRGWAIKNVAINNTVQPIMNGYSNSDRLIDVSTFPQAVPEDNTASDDILDEYSNPVAQQFEHMITESEQQHRQALIDQMNAPAPAPSPVTPSVTSLRPDDGHHQWFMRQPTAKTSKPLATNQNVVIDHHAVQPGLQPTGQEGPAAYSNMRTIQPLDAQTDDIQAATPPPDNTVTAVTPPADPAILNLANNNDLNIATLAREASKAKGEEMDEGDEVVISLH
jgi:hypothetical protein